MAVPETPVSFPLWPQADANGSNRSSDRRNVLGHDAVLDHDAEKIESDTSSSRRMLGLQSSRHG